MIIPTFNWATVLPFSIGSVLDQTFTDFELLVIGDACTDESAAVVRACAAGDDRVRWHNLPTNGRSQAGPNNEGLRLGRGDLVAYLGHDDLWLPRHLEGLVAVLDRGPTIVRSRVVQVNPEAPPFAVPALDWRYTPGEWVPRRASPTGATPRSPSADGGSPPTRATSIPRATCGRASRERSSHRCSSPS